MRIQSLLTIAAALAMTLPLSAGQRHRGDDYRGYDSRRGPAISVQVGTPFGFGVFQRGFDRDRRFDRYDDRRFRDSRRFKQRQKFIKKMRKQRLRDHRRFYHQRHHVHGPACWY